VKLLIVIIGGLFACSYYAAASNPTDPQSAEFFQSIADIRSTLGALDLAHSPVFGGAIVILAVGLFIYRRCEARRSNG
jgi:hypothetical protein